MDIRQGQSDREEKEAGTVSTSCWSCKLKDLLYPSNVRSYMLGTTEVLSGLR